MCGPPGLLISPCLCLLAQHAVLISARALLLCCFRLLGIAGRALLSLDPDFDEKIGIMPLQAVGFARMPFHNWASPVCPPTSRQHAGNAIRIFSTTVAPPLSILTAEGQNRGLLLRSSPLLRTDREEGRALHSAAPSPAPRRRQAPSPAMLHAPACLELLTAAPRQPCCPKPCCTPALLHARTKLGPWSTAMPRVAPVQVQAHGRPSSTAGSQFREAKGFQTRSCLLWCAIPVSATF